jgi:hypothetical protein
MLSITITMIAQLHRGFIGRGGPMRLAERIKAYLQFTDELEQNINFIRTHRSVIILLIF